MTGLSRHTLALALVLPLAAGCGTQAYEPLSADFGNSVRHNMMMQVVNPDPPAATEGAPTGSGSRAALAYSRYENGKVAKAPGVATSSVGGTGGTGGAAK